MRIIIIGDGKMGFELSRCLSNEGHDIVIIDNNPDALRLSSNTQDVACICGNGIDSDVQIEAGVPGADLVVAVTSKDEINIICCLIAKKLGVKHTIARVRSPEMGKSLNFMREELGLSLSVNPEMAAATEISRMLRVPSAAKVDFFAKGRVELVEIKIEEGSPLDGQVLSGLPGRYHVKILVCAIQRDGEVFIPNGNSVLRAGDQISISASPANITQFFRLAGLYNQKARDVMIVGGGMISFYLSRMLADTGVKVKIIETDKQRCEELSELLPKAMVIHGDGSDQEMLHEEGMEETDALVALTGLDEENVVISMYALARKVGKVITKVNHITFGGILEKAGIRNVITPHLIAANHILRYVRAMQNSLGSNVEALSRIVNNQAEALEFRVRSNFSGRDTELKDLKLKKGLMIACIIRGAQVIFPSGTDSIRVGDSVIVVTTGTGPDDLNDIFRS